MTRRAVFRQSDLQRALSTALKLGLPVTGYRITPEGEIVVSTGQTATSADDALEAWQRGRHG